MIQNISSVEFLIKLQIKLITHPSFKNLSNNDDYTVVLWIVSS